jgi:hypothetical protein
MLTMIPVKASPPLPVCDHLRLRSIRDVCCVACCRCCTCQRCCVCWACCSCCGCSVGCCCQGGSPCCSARTEGCVRSNSCFAAPIVFALFAGAACRSSVRVATAAAAAAATALTALSGSASAHCCDVWLGTKRKAASEVPDDAAPPLTKIARRCSCALLLALSHSFSLLCWFAVLPLSRRTALPAGSATRMKQRRTVDRGPRVWACRSPESALGSSNSCTVVLLTVTNMLFSSGISSCSLRLLLWMWGIQLRFSVRS